PAAGLLDVLERLQTARPVVRFLEGAAESARAADVGLDPGVTLGDEEGGERRPADARAAGRAAVIRDDDGELFRLRLRQEDVDREREAVVGLHLRDADRSEEHTSELQSLAYLV